MHSIKNLDTAQLRFGTQPGRTQIQILLLVAIPCKLSIRKTSKGPFYEHICIDVYTAWQSEKYHWSSTVAMLGFVCTQILPVVANIPGKT
jgi:hypothetical protein